MFTLLSPAAAGDRLSRQEGRLNSTRLGECRFFPSSSQLQWDCPGGSFPAPTSGNHHSGYHRVKWLVHTSVGKDWYTAKVDFSPTHPVIDLSSVDARVIRLRPRPIRIHGVWHVLPCRLCRRPSTSANMHSPGNRHRAVSYTHLDVYKRQVLILFFFHAG